MQLVHLVNNKDDLEDEELLRFYLYLTELLPLTPPQNYVRFELDKYTDEECLLLGFRFQKVDVLHLVTALRLPNQLFARMIQSLAL